MTSGSNSFFDRPVFLVWTVTTMADSPVSWWLAISNPGRTVNTPGLRSRCKFLRIVWSMAWGVSVVFSGMRQASLTDLGVLSLSSNFSGRPGAGVACGHSGIGCKRSWTTAILRTPLACLSSGMSGSAFFHNVRNSCYEARAWVASPGMA